MSPTTKTAPVPRMVEVEFLYLDLDTCDRCQGADANLDAAIALLAPVLTETGVALRVEKRLVGSLEEARELNFVSSPTIRVGGHDIVLDVQEDACGACSEIAGTPVACRAWTWRGEEHPVPPTGMLVEALLRALYGGARPTEAGPGADEANLAAFFAGKAKAGAGSCASGGCGCGD